VARHAGDDLAILSSAVEGGPYTSIGCFTQASANQTRDRFEVTCGGDANKTYVLGKKDFTVTGTMIFDDTNNAIWDAADTDTPLFYRVHPDLADLPNYYWQGQFYIDASIDIPVNGPITQSINMAASGDITHVTS
jgi:hypothetical protein